jgi:hypothetical protein
VGGTPAVTLKEDAMTRLESSAWPLAGGSACVFGLAVVLNRLPWQVTFAVIVLAVLTWAWQSPVITGAALGGIAWLCVTGFDVHRLADIRVTGRDDVLRAALLVAAGVLAAVLRVAAAGARRGFRPADPVWADFYEAESGPIETAGALEHLSHAGPRTPDRGNNDG